MPRFVLILPLFLALLAPALAVVIDDSGTYTYQIVEPTNTDVANWTSDWGSSGVTGWDYVGQFNVSTDSGGASGVYLGNGWVITAGHVGVNDTSSFTLDGITYGVVAHSETSISNTFGTADLTLFEITGTPSLPSLSITSFAPTLGGTVVIIGYGDNGTHAETWGANKVSGNNVLVQVNSYESVDFYTDYTGTTNKAQLVAGDSGGGDFTYNSFAHQWQLAGLNEAVSTDGMGTVTGTSYFVQLSEYRSQINAIVAVPEPHTWTYLVLGVLLLGVYRKVKARFYRG